MGTSYITCQADPKYGSIEISNTAVIQWFAGLSDDDKHEWVQSVTDHNSAVVTNYTIDNVGDPNEHAPLSMEITYTYDHITEIEVKGFNIGEKE